MSWIRVGSSSKARPTRFAGTRRSSSASSRFDYMGARRGPARPRSVTGSPGRSEPPRGAWGGSLPLVVHQPAQVGDALEGPSIRYRLDDDPLDSELPQCRPYSDRVVLSRQGTRQARGLVDDEVVLRIVNDPIAVSERADHREPGPQTLAVQVNVDRLGQLQLQRVHLAPARADGLLDVGHRLALRHEPHEVADLPFQAFNLLRVVRPFFDRPGMRLTPAGDSLRAQVPNHVLVSQLDVELRQDFPVQFFHRHAAVVRAGAAPPPLDAVVPRGPVVLGHVGHAPPTDAAPEEPGQ